MTSEKHALELRSDVKLLGDLLGKIIIEQEGQEVDARRFNTRMVERVSKGQRFEVERCDREGKTFHRTARLHIPRC